MKINLSFPATGCQKLVEIADELKVRPDRGEEKERDDLTSYFPQVRPFYEKRMGQEMEADTLGDEFKGYVVRITGGNDKQGFPMKQGILTNGRVRLLLKEGHSCYRPRRNVSLCCPDGGNVLNVEIFSGRT